MPHYNAGNYKCSECDQVSQRSLLVAKKIQFTGLGAGAKILRSRTIKWLCNECIELDPDYQLPAFSNSPGHKSPALERVRALESSQEV